MNKKTLLIIFAMISLFPAVAGCVGKRPFLIVQLCVQNEQGVASFKEVMKSVAQAERMEFFDGSASVERDLIELKKNPNYPLVYMGIKREDGSGLEAGNMGLSAYEMAVGFSEGKNPADARKFSDVVIQALAKKWRVTPVPSGRGAVPTACKIQR